jgi:hypothetical protein
MTLREISPEVFNDVDDGALFELDNTKLPDPFKLPTLSNLTATNTGIIADDGSYVSSLVVSWDVSLPALVDSYTLEWKKSSATEYNSVNLKTKSYQIPSVEDGATYDIRVKAFNAVGVSTQYLTTFIIAGPDTTAPKAPSNVTVSGGYASATVTWDAPTQNTDGSPLKDLFQYRVYRGTSPNPTTPVGRVSGEAFTESGLDDNQTYYYRVKAIDFTGNESAYSTDASATTNPQLQDGTDGSDGSDGADGADGARGPGRWYIPVATLPTTTLSAEIAWNNAPSEIPDKPVVGDQAWFYRGTESNPTGQAVFICDSVSSTTSHNWNYQEEVIDGDLLVSGTVTADKISVNKLDAISADLGTIEADTVNIAGNAVSYSKYYVSGSTYVGDDTWDYVFSTGEYAPADTITRAFFAVDFEQGYAGQRDWSYRIQTSDGFNKSREYMAAISDYSTVTGMVELDRRGLSDSSIVLTVEWRGESQGPGGEQIFLQPGTTLTMEISYK